MNLSADDEEADEVAEMLAPFGHAFPGLADHESAVVHPGAQQQVVAELQGRLGLVPVKRPADAVAALGWSSPVNVLDDTGQLAAVLRTREDCFGAVAVGVGFDRLTLAVTGRRGALMRRCGSQPSTRRSARTTSARAPTRSRRTRRPSREAPSGTSVGTDPAACPSPTRLQPVSWSQPQNS
jgi:hypothetical protein